jgi:ArsR family transcriptional regulator
MNQTLSTQTPTATMWDFMAITKALADENRVRMLLALRDQELCLCQIIELIALAPSTVSKHMSILRQSRLVEGRKSGRWMYYRLAGPGVSPAVRKALEWVRHSLADDPQVARDAERLKEVLTLDPQVICERQIAPRRSNKNPRRRTTTRRR